jgi:hypothetical protein
LLLGAGRRRRRYQRAGPRTGEFRATWYDLFPGGCLTYQLHSTSDVKGSFTADLPALLTFATRDALRQALRQRCGGRLWLDPRGRRSFGHLKPSGEAVG